MPGFSYDFSSVTRLFITIIGAYSVYLSLSCCPCNVIYYFVSGFRVLNFNYLFFHRTVFLYFLIVDLKLVDLKLMDLLSGFAVSAPLVTQSLLLKFVLMLFESYLYFVDNVLLSHLLHV